MIQEYKDILKNAKANKKSIARQISRLRKMRKGEVDDLIHPLHDEVFEEIDCLQCANCCTTTSPIITERDVQRISKQLGMKAAEFTQKYVFLDSDQEYAFKQTPCAFLGEDKYCGIYTSRPKACSEFPHTNQTNQIGILKLTETNATICPAVARIFENLDLESAKSKKKRKK